MVEGQIFTIQFATNGVSFQYQYPYYLWELSDLVATWTDPLGNVTTLMLDTDYTLTGNPDEFGSWPDGVIYTGIGPNSPLATGTLTLTRFTARTQMSTWIDNNPFPADQEEHGFDKLTLMIQEISAYFLGFLSQPPSTTQPIGAWFIQYPIIPGTYFGWCMTTGGWKQFAPVSF
jgi:hypothetical protein